MKVLHVISSIDRRQGGPTTALRGLTSAQARIGAEVSVLSTYSAGEDCSMADELRALGIAVDLVGPAAGPLKSHPRLGGAVADAVADADVVHIHAVWEEIQHQAALLSRKIKAPYIVRPCGMLDPWSLAQSRWKKRLYLAWRLKTDLNHAASIHYTADLERDQAAPLNLKPPAIVEPNGIDLSEFKDLPAAGTFRTAFDLAPDRPLILFLSRVHPKKGLDYLLPAFARLEDHRAVLVIAGPDSDGYIAELGRLAEQLGITDRVIFTGMLHGERRLAALRDADLFVLPSRQENFGIAVVEAMAAGTPVVISDQVNIFREVIAAGAGAAVPVGVEPLAAALGQWMADPQRRQRAGEDGRRFVFERYDWNLIAARWNQHYVGLAGRATRPAVTV